MWFYCLLHLEENKTFETCVLLADGTDGDLELTGVSPNALTQRRNALIGIKRQIQEADALQIVLAINSDQWYQVEYRKWFRYKVIILIWLFRTSCAASHYSFTLTDLLSHSDLNGLGVLLFSVFFGVPLSRSRMNPYNPVLETSTIPTETHTYPLRTHPHALCTKQTLYAALLQENNQRRAVWWSRVTVTITALIIFP